METKYRVIVNFYSPKKGGRKTSIGVGYRPHFIPYGTIPSENTMYGVQFVVLPPQVDMSKTIEAEVEFLYKGVNYNRLFVGDKCFLIYEGPNLIGEGKFIG